MPNLNSPCSVERAYLAERLVWIADTLHYSSKSMVGLPALLKTHAAELKAIAEELKGVFPCEPKRQ